MHAGQEYQLPGSPSLAAASEPALCFLSSARQRSLSMHRMEHLFNKNKTSISAEICSGHKEGKTMLD